MFAGRTAWSTSESGTGRGGAINAKAGSGVGAAGAAGGTAGDTEGGGGDGVARRERSSDSAAGETYEPKTLQQQGWESALSQSQPDGVVRQARWGSPTVEAWWVATDSLPAGHRAPPGTIARRGAPRDPRRHRRATHA